MHATTITINGLMWTVAFVDKDDPNLSTEEGKIIFGQTYFRRCEIYIDKDLPEPLFRQILVHELVHAVSFSYGVDLESATEENFCEFIGAHFEELASYREAVLKCV